MVAFQRFLMMAEVNSEVVAEPRSRIELDDERKLKKTHRPYQLS
jgi:hypothetical protein